MYACIASSHDNEKGKQEIDYCNYLVVIRLKVWDRLLGQIQFVNWSSILTFISAFRQFSYET